MEWNVYINERINPRNYDVTVLGWRGGADFDKRSIFHSAYLPPNGLNFAEYNSKEADQLMEDILLEYDPQKQIEIARKVFRTIANDCPYIFLYGDVLTAAFDRHFYWSKPVVDINGALVRGPDGLPLYEARSLVDPELMTLTSGPGYQLYQYRRAGEVRFPSSPGELKIVCDDKAFEALKAAQADR